MQAPPTDDDGSPAASEAGWPQHLSPVSPPAPPPPTDPHRRRDLSAAWVLGLLAGLAVVGPGLGTGAWLNVDLVVTPDTPLPRGVWGLGPELPRRVPYAVPFAWLSTVMDSTWAQKAVVVAAIAAAVAGAWRLAARWFPETPMVARAGSGLLFGISPFLLTRLGVGHLPLVFAMGLLPWALPSLLRPEHDGRRTFLWCAALGLTGSFGGVPTALAVLVGIGCARRGERRVVTPLLVLFVSQATWWVPGLSVLLQGASPTAASDFRTDDGGAGGLVRLLAGHGFWRTPSQVGFDDGWLVPLLGVAVLGLAVVGGRRLPAAVRLPAVVLAALGVVVPASSAAPLVSSWYATLVDSPLSAALREGQRLLPLYLVVVAPAAAGGAARLASRLPGWREGMLLVSAGAAALLLAGPGLWGVQGALEPVDLPPSWTAARSAIRAGGGTVLSLPYYQYSPEVIADGRDVVDPMPTFLGGDVLSSSDPGLSTPSQEKFDPREETVLRLVAQIRADAPAATDLAALGVRWVVLRHNLDWRGYGSLRTDGGFRSVVRADELELFEVTGWAGEAVDGSGGSVSVDQVVAPIASLDSNDRVIWYRPASSGWLRGFEPARATRSGLLTLPGGGGVVWFWPAIVVIAADVLVAAVAFGCWRSLRAGRTVPFSTLGDP